MFDPKSLFRSQLWFDSHDTGMTALYIERYLNYGLTQEELQSNRPIIGIAVSGSELTPCNIVHVELANRVAEGIRDAGGIPIKFPTYPLQETGIRPTAALHRNLAALTLAEILRTYPIDGVVLTTGCDKTVPAALMAAASIDIPAIGLSGGPMLNGWSPKGEREGSGTVIWKARQMMGKGEIDASQFMEMACRSAPSVGHCNTMGTALSMNCLMEALGMSLPGCASIPAPYRERGQMGHATGVRIVEMVMATAAAFAVKENRAIPQQWMQEQGRAWNNVIKFGEKDYRPSQILTRENFLNAIKVASAIGASSNCPPHLLAIAAHIGVELSMDDWQEQGHHVPLLVNCMPAGSYLGEDFHRAGGVPAVIQALIKAGEFYPNAPCINGKTMGENNANTPSHDAQIIASYQAPIKEKAGFIVMSGNLFDNGIMKTSVIDAEFRSRYLSEAGNENVFTGRAIVFDGPEDYHHRIEDTSLNIDEHCILVIRGCGTVGYPGSAEVVNMQPPSYLLAKGIKSLPTLGDGRQSGTSASPSILNCSPEALAEGNLRLLRTGDKIRVDLNKRTVDMLITTTEMEARITDHATISLPEHQSFWEELYRQQVSQLHHGGHFKEATKSNYRQSWVGKAPRDSH
ncbi:MAG: IlvD/Edd family dehydratase [Alphaproteobacteria bacterium]